VYECVSEYQTISPSTTTLTHTYTPPSQPYAQPYAHLYPPTRPPTAHRNTYLPTHPVPPAQWHPTSPLLSLHAYPCSVSGSLATTGHLTYPILPYSTHHTAPPFSPLRPDPIVVPASFRPAYSDTQPTPVPVPRAPHRPRRCMKSVVLTVDRWC
jgi:hypothetical protein